MITEQQLDKLYSACLKLPDTSVIEEEAHVSGSPLLIAMSTVLSLNRRWYSHALPARQRFERGQYGYLSNEPLEAFSEVYREMIGDNGDWKKFSDTLWKNKEWQKAKQLTQLVDYLSDWCRKFHPELDERAALKRWASETSKESFLGKIHGLGPRAYEQLLWYIEGVNSIKLDRHVTKFLRGVLGVSVSEEDGINALKNIAAKMGISATSLDARIWDHMQSQPNT